MKTFKEIRGTKSKFSGFPEYPESWGIDKKKQSKKRPKGSVTWAGFTIPGGKK